MEYRTHEQAKTLRFQREAITTPFARDPVDADDTVPVELYSRPYERLDIQPESTAYERIEIELDVDVADLQGDLIRDARGRSLWLVLAMTILCGTFALGVGFAFLVM